MQVFTLTATFLWMLQKTRLCLFNLFFMWAVHETFLSTVISSRSFTSLSVHRSFLAKWSSLSIPRISTVGHLSIASSLWLLLNKESIASQSAWTSLWLISIAGIFKSSPNKYGSPRWRTSGTPLMKKQNSRGHSRNPWGTPLVVDITLELVLSARTD